MQTKVVVDGITFVITEDLNEIHTITVEDSDRDVNNVLTDVQKAAVVALALQIT